MLVFAYLLRNLFIYSFLFSDNCSPMARSTFLQSKPAQMKAYINVWCLLMALVLWYREQPDWKLQVSKTKTNFFPRLSYHVVVPVVSDEIFFRIICSKIGLAEPQISLGWDLLLCRFCLRLLESWYNDLAQKSVTLFSKIGQNPDNESTNLI